jgi:hypothetical protein
MIHQSAMKAVRSIKSDRLTVLKNGDDRIKFSHEFQGQDEYRYIQYQIGQADGNVHEVVEDHGDACDTACEKVMGNKEYIESGGIDESADEGDDKYEENALYADRIVPMLTDIGAHDDLLWDVPME